MPMDFPSEFFDHEEHPRPEKASDAAPPSLAPTLTAYHHVHHRGLEAVLDVRWPDGRTDHEVRYYLEGSNRRITPPLRFAGTDRSYWLSTFVDLDSQQSYECQILAAIDQYLGGHDVK